MVSGGDIFEIESDRGAVNEWSGEDDPWWELEEIFFERD